jgi:glucose-6-phosphate isomerase/transaldolase/glucose-6-phosphate isomerase
MHSAHDVSPLGSTARRARLEDSLSLSPGSLEQSISTYRAIAMRAAAGLFKRDPSVWTSDAAVQQKIANRLGWLTAPALMSDSVTRLRAFADAVQREPFSHVVLMGMGGSSLAPEVLRAILGLAPGRPRFQMIDSTDPAAVRSAASPPERTLYLLASKSGTTIEPNSLAAHFRHRLEQAGVSRWADHFVAITDDGTALAARARAERFRDVFINPSDIGGRYSALSFFGLVPAALMGHDVEAIVGWGIAMLEEAAVVDDAGSNPAVDLGMAMGAAARKGRDKTTLVLPPLFEPFGLWVEQLVAESTGKQGVGIVPIAGEPVGAPGAYGNDRLFVHLRSGSADETHGPAVGRLRAAGAPVVTIDVAEPAALGAEFVRWEIATAVASAILDVNPFDEPNVQQAKDATRVLLEGYKTTGQLPAVSTDASVAGAAASLTSAARQKLANRRPDAFLTLAGTGDYVGLLAYVPPDREVDSLVSAFLQAVRDRTRAATMFGYGPRYLHSTGQLHKGGPNNGVFVVMTVTPDEDLPIPGEPFSFGTLERAQAIGDFQSLDATGRRALHIHLPSPDHEALQAALNALLEGLACATS